MLQHIEVHAAPPHRIGGWIRQLTPTGRRLLRWLAIILGTLLLLRLLLPYVLLGFINHALARPGPVRGEVADLSLSLWRGGYQVHGLTLTVARDDGQPKPLLDVARIDIGLDWGQLIHGRVRSTLALERPVLVITPSGPGNDQVGVPDSAAHQTPEGAEKKAEEKAKEAVAPPTPPVEHWQDRVRTVVAFRIDSLAIFDGRLRYTDPERGFDAGLERIEAEIRNVSGGRDDGHPPAPATFRLTAVTMGGGDLRVDGTVDPWAYQPTFDLRAVIEHLDLVQLNGNARRLNGLSFRSGSFSAFAEARAVDGNLQGYIKPLFIGLEVATYGTVADSAATRLFWNTVVAVAEDILPNSDTAALAGRVPFHGRIDRPQTAVWTIIGSVLGNAFLSAILPGYDGIDRFTTK